MKKVKNMLRYFSWRAGVDDAIGQLHQEQQRANQNKNLTRDLEMQYALNSLMYLLNRGFK